MKKKTVLVLGGSYFLGVSIIQNLLDKDFDVTVLNRGTRQSKFEKIVGQIICDRSDLKAMTAVLSDKNFEYIIDISGMNLKDVEISYETTKHMKSKYIFISSSAVYTPPCSLPIKETDETGFNPFWKNYGTDKIDAENFLLNKSEKNGFELIILRPPYIYGENNYVYRESYVFERLLANKPIIYPKSDCLIQFLYVDDLADAIFTLMTHGNLNDKIFNIGNEEGVSFKEWIHTCASAAGILPITVEFDNIKNEYDPRDFFPFYEYEYVLDTNKLKKLHTNKTSLENGLKKSYNWYMKNKDSIVRKEHFYENERKIMEIINKK